MLGGPINNGGVLVRRYLGLDWFGVAQFTEQVLDLFLHREACFAVFMDWSIVPFDVDASIFFAFPIHGNLVISLECHLEVTGVAFSNVFHPKIIN